MSSEDESDIDEPISASKIPSKVKSEAKTKPKAKSTTKSKAKTKAKPKAKSTTKSKAKTKTKPKAKSTTKSKAKTKSKPKAKSTTKSKAKTKAKPKAKSKSKSPDGKKKTLKVSNQIPRERRDKIQKSLSKAKGRKRSEWDRAGGPKQHRVANKRVKPNSIRRISMPLLDVTLGDNWATPITVLHGARPGPVVTVTGAIHGDELVGPLACSMLCQESMTGPGRPLDPSVMAGTLRIIPVLNPPGYRRLSRYFPDGRDLNRQFPGSVDGNTTSRVADKIWENLIINTDYLIDLHCAAVGRTNLPQVRANLAHSESNKLARAFGVEVILDSKGPRGTLRRNSTEEGIGSLTYEGGGATQTDHEAVKVAVHGVLNVLRSFKMIPGYPSRPRFRLLASGSTWVRAEEGGLVDMFVQAGSYIEKGDIIGRIVDPQKPGMSADILSPESGLIICSATNPFVTAGTPVGHLLPITRGVRLVKSQLDDHKRLIVSGSIEDPPWREEYEVDEIAIHGEWQGGDVDSEWQRDWGNQYDVNTAAASSEEEEGSEEEQ